MSFRGEAHSGAIAKGPGSECRLTEHESAKAGPQSQLP
jgi:hypothetical protein